MMSNNKPTKNKPIKMQTNHLKQTVKDPLMILNTVREPQDQLLHHTNPLLGERVESSTSDSIIDDSTTSFDSPQLN